MVRSEGGSKVEWFWKEEKLKNRCLKILMGVILRIILMGKENCLKFLWRIKCV